MEGKGQNRWEKWVGLGERSGCCQIGKMLSRQNILHRCFLGCCISVGLQYIPMVPSSGSYTPLFPHHSRTPRRPHLPPQCGPYLFSFLSPSLSLSPTIHSSLPLFFSSCYAGPTFSVFSLSLSITHHSL